MLSWMIAGFLGMVVSIGLWVWWSSRTIIAAYYELDTDKHYTCGHIIRFPDLWFPSVDILRLRIYTDEDVFLGTYEAIVPAGVYGFTLVDQSGHWFLRDNKHKERKFPLAKREGVKPGGDRQ